MARNIHELQILIKLFTIPELLYPHHMYENLFRASQIEGLCVSKLKVITFITKMLSVRNYN